MKTKYIFHKDITENELLEVIKIKSIAWPYSLENQLQWIKDNIEDDDIHVLLMDEKNDVKAYLNMIAIVFKINGKINSGFGIGNVCALEKGKGWGKELIISVNSYLKDNGQIGILFCKQVLVKFYSENDWNLIENEKIILKKAFENIKCMISNKELNLKKLEYTGKLF